MAPFIWMAVFEEAKKIRPPVDFYPILRRSSSFTTVNPFLQERTQKAGKELTYRLVSESGPDHDKVFVIEALIDGECVGSGTGKSKKSAEQQAAYGVLKKSL